MATLTVIVSMAEATDVAFHIIPPLNHRDMYVCVCIYIYVVISNIYMRATDLVSGELDVPSRLVVVVIQCRFESHEH
jgi:hypothetical protein